MTPRRSRLKISQTSSAYLSASRSQSLAFIRAEFALRPWQGAAASASGSTEDATADAFTAGEIAASLRTRLVDRAEHRGGIECDTRAVAALIHAAHAVVLRDEMLGHHIARAQLDHQMAATAAAGARGKIGMVGDGREKVES